MEGCIGPIGVYQPRAEVGGDAKRLGAAVLSVMLGLGV